MGDWVAQNKVSPVKNQGKCGSCWTFSATGAMEAHIAIQFNRYIDLSQQQLLDCSADYGEKGCDGGNMPGAYAYARDNGMMSAGDYPYQGRVGQCNYDRNRLVAGVETFYRVRNSDEALVDSLQ